MPTGIPVTSGELVDTGYLNEVARAHWRRPASLDVANTVTETDLLGGAITIDANAMGGSRCLRATLLGSCLYNNNSADTLRLRVKLGGTTLLDAAGILSPIAINRFAWRISVEIMNLNVTNAQQVMLAWHSGNRGVPTTGDAGAVGTPLVGALVIGGSAIDTTTAKTFAVTAQWSAASANNSFLIYCANIEVV